MQLLFNPLSMLKFFENNDKFILWAKYFWKNYWFLYIIFVQQTCVYHKLKNCTTYIHQTRPASAAQVRTPRKTGYPLTLKYLYEFAKKAEILAFDHLLSARRQVPSLLWLPWYLRWFARRRGLFLSEARGQFHRGRLQLLGCLFQLYHREFDMFHQVQRSKKEKEKWEEMSNGGRKITTKALW